MSPELWVMGWSGVNLVVLLGIVLRAGKLLQAFATVTSEVAMLRQRSDVHGELLARTIAQLDGLEHRVGLLERA